MYNRINSSVMLKARKASFGKVVGYNELRSCYSENTERYRIGSVFGALRALHASFPALAV